ncbi:MAG: adenosylmethionine decarboxylase [Pseudomonadota bacterium]
MRCQYFAPVGACAEAEASAEAVVNIKTGPRALDDGALDYFVERNGLRYAGSHLIIDLWGAHHLDDVALVERTLRRAVVEAGATLLHVHFHKFSPNGGISGVVVLAESHISIHTWPERGYAAIDVFMCGGAEPHKVVPILRNAFQTERVVVNEQMRGII